MCTSPCAGAFGRWDFLRVWDLPFDKAHTCRVLLGNAQEFRPAEDTRAVVWKLRLGRVLPAPPNSEQARDPLCSFSQEGTAALPDPPQNGEAEEGEVGLSLPQPGFGSGIARTEPIPAALGLPAGKSLPKPSQLGYLPK
uniref:Uncharacterized protein n=1 Tax=Junco hyemalis TaxID=40217 RepID=A0A8C5IUZ5_JUNHY